MELFRYSALVLVTIWHNKDWWKANAASSSPLLNEAECIYSAFTPSLSVQILHFPLSVGSIQREGRWVKQVSEWCTDVPRSLWLGKACNRDVAQALFISLGV